MTQFDIRQFAISSVGAVALSAACVLAAVGPARAANAPVTTADWARAVEAKVSGADAASSKVAEGRVAETVVAVRFDGQGDFAGAAVARSSGNAALDARALRVAQHVAYPALPAGMRGQPQTVTLRLAFGGEADIAAHFARTARPATRYAATSVGSFRIAAK